MTDHGALAAASGRPPTQPPRTRRRAPRRRRSAGAGRAFSTAPRTGVVTEAIVPVTLDDRRRPDPVRARRCRPARPAAAPNRPAACWCWTAPACTPSTSSCWSTARSSPTSHTFVDRPPATPPAAGPTQVAVVADVDRPRSVARRRPRWPAARTELQALAESADALGGAITVRDPPVVADDIAANAPGAARHAAHAFADAEVLRRRRPRSIRRPPPPPGLQDVFAAPPARRRGPRDGLARPRPRRALRVARRRTDQHTGRVRCCAIRSASTSSSSTPTSTDGLEGRIGGYPRLVAGVHRRARRRSPPCPASSSARPATGSTAPISTVVSSRRPTAPCG